MPKQFVTVSHKDLGRGLDARSVQNQIQDGYWEKLVNLDPSSSGFVSTRKGTSLYAGELPLPILSATYRTNGGDYIDFELDPDIVNFSIVGSFTAPIIVQGRTWRADSRDFDDTTIRTRYYSGFTVTGNNTIRVLGTQNYTPATGAIGDLDELVVWGLRGAIAHPELVNTNHLDTYRNTLTSQILAIEEGRLYWTKSPQDTASFDNQGNSSLADLGLATAGQTLDIAFLTTGTAAPYRTEGAILSSGVSASNKARVSKVEYSGGETKLTVALPSWALTGAGTLADAFTAGGKQVITLSDMPISNLNGDFFINSVDGSDPDSLVFGITVSGEGAWWNLADSGAEGWGDASVNTYSFTIQTPSDDYAQDGDIVDIGDGINTYTVVAKDSLDRYILKRTDGGNSPYQPALNQAMQLLGRTSKEWRLTDVDNFVIGDVIQVSGNEGSFEVMDLSVASGVMNIELDREATRAVDDTTFDFKVLRRWIPVFGVDSPDISVIPPANVTYFEDQSSLNKSTTVANNLYFTDGSNPVMKYDGANISRAGVPEIQPTVFVSINPSGGSISNNYQAVDYSATTLASFRMTTADDRALYSPGDTLVDSYDGQEYTVEKTWIDDAGTYGYVQVLGGINGGATTRSGTIGRAYKHRYYIRFEIVDANDNVISSAMYLHQDLEVTLSSASDVSFVIKTPILEDFVDYGRMRVKLFRTKADTVFPFYKVKAQYLNVSGDSTIIIDDVADIALNEEDPIGILVPNEIGTGWVGPPVASYITSVGNRVVLGNIQDQYRLLIDITKNMDYSTFTATKDEHYFVNGYAEFFSIVEVPDYSVEVQYGKNIGTGGGYNEISVWSTGLFQLITYNRGMLTYHWDSAAFGLSFLVETPTTLYVGPHSNSIQSAATGSICGWYKPTIELNTTITTTNGTFSSWSQPGAGDLVNGDIVFYSDNAAASPGSYSGAAVSSTYAPGRKEQGYYYVVNATPGGTFQLSQTPGGSALSLTTTSLGKFSCTRAILSGDKDARWGDVSLPDSVGSVAGSGAIEFTVATFGTLPIGTLVKFTDLGSVTLTNGSGGPAFGEQELAYIDTAIDNNTITLRSVSTGDQIVSVTGTLFQIQTLAFLYSAVPNSSSTKYSTLIPGFGYSATLSGQRTLPSNEIVYSDVVEEALSGTSSARSWQVAKAINGVSSLLGYKFAAFSGQDYPAGRLVVRCPEDVYYTFTHTGYGSDFVFANEVQLFSGEEAAATKKIFPSRAVMSYVNYPEVFDSPFVQSDSDSDSVLDINSADGQQLTGIIPFFSESSFGQGRQEGLMVAFKESSIYIVDTNAKANGQNYLHKLATNGIGCTAPKSIVQTSKGVVFANESGVYRLNPDLKLEFLGKNLKREFEDEVKLSSGSVVDWSGHNYIFENKYILSNPDTGKAFVYDWVREEGPEGIGAWTTYTNFPFTWAANLNQDSFLLGDGGRVLVRNQTGTSVDFRDSQEAISVEGIYKATDLGESGSRKIVSHVYLSSQTQDDHHVNIDVSFLHDLKNTEEAAGTFNVESDSGKDVQVAAFSPPTRRIQYIQVKIANDNIDQNTTLSQIDFWASGLNSDNGRVQKADL